MSVLIRSMEIPECCDVCQFSDWSNLHQTASCKLMEYQAGFDDDSFEYRRKRADFCPLVEVQPHGRLIDADAFDERVRVAGGMSEEELTEDFKDGVQTVLYMLSKQPPIIEAEGSEEPT